MAMRARLEAALNRIWTRRGAPARLLWPLSCLFRAAVFLRRRRFDGGARQGEKLPVPVIVVGSVMAGGTGKTPVIIALAQHLQAAGLCVGVISRGYGRCVRNSGDDVQEVHADSDAQNCGDEPLLIHRKTGVPVFVARQRVHAARALLAQHPQTQILLADDGLQHYALARDAEICVLDARGTGNGFLLPAGPLREPWPRRPAAAIQFVLHTSPSAADGFVIMRTLANHAVRADGSTIALAELRDRPVQALAAIAQPQAFFDMLRAQGLTLTATFALPDHASLAAWQPPDASVPLLCTEKDAVKLWPRLPQALAVPLNVRLPGDFLQALDAAARGWLSKNRDV